MLLNHIPDIVTQYLIDSQSRKIQLPEKQSFKTLLMYTNIPQFAQIAANYTRNSIEGLENLSNFLNKFLEVFHDTVAKAEGEILKFLNDKLIVMWPPFDESTDEDISNVCKRAVQSALDLQKRLFETITSEGFKPKVSISFGLGELSILHVGGVQDSVEYLVVGEALLQAVECDNMMQEENDIVVNSLLLERIRENFIYEQIRLPQQVATTKSGNFYVVKSILKANFPRVNADPMAYKRSINTSTLDLIRPKILSYIQKEFINFINTGHELWGCEYRRCTVAHIHVGLNILELDKDIVISRVHQIIRKIQTVVFELEGSLYRAITDQKGLTLIVIFGLYPKSHQEDAARAVYTAFALRRELKKIGLTISIGLAEGTALSTFLGFERRDIAFLGDCVYVSYLLMLAAIGEKEKKILMNENVKVASEEKVSFRSFSNAKYKGRLAQENLYEPVEFTDDSPAPPVNFNRFPELRTHYKNLPYAPNASVETFQESKYMIGKDLQLMRCRELLDDFLRNPTKPATILIAGTFGSGKSLFARNFMDSAAELINSNVNFSARQGTRPLLISSSVTPQNRDQKLNGWTKIMRFLLKLVADKKSLTKEEMVQRILDGMPDIPEGMNLVKDILNLSPQGSLQAGALQTEEDLPGKEQLDLTAQKNIVRILMAILQECSGENTSRGDTSLRLDRDYLGVSSRKMSLDDDGGSPPMIICLDDMQLHDSLSWNLVNRVSAQLKKVFIIGMIRIDEFDTTPERAALVEEGILNLGSQGQNVHKILLEKMTAEEISQYVRNFFGSRISNDSLNRFLLEKGEGNPSTIYSLLRNLIQQEFVTKSNDEIILSEKMRMLLKLGDFSEIHAPDVRYKANSTRIDKTDLTQYFLMKVASVIGNKFDLKTLVVINPFKGSVITNANAVKALEGLKNLELIEIVEEGKDRNTVYRFALPFLREVVYQRLPLSIRKQLHRLVAEAFQNTSSRFAVGGEQRNLKFDSRSEEKVAFHWDKSDQGAESENLSTPSKRALILDGVTYQLSGREDDVDALLKTGILQKKAIRTRGKWMNRFVVVTLKALKWYLSENSYQTTPDGQAGTVFLQHIYNVRIFKDGEGDVRMGKTGIVLEVGKWYKGYTENGARDIVFACKDQEDAEAWYIFLEYARAKAIYDDFLNNFEATSPSSRQALLHQSSQKRPERLKKPDESPILERRLGHPASILKTTGASPTRTQTRERFQGSMQRSGARPTRESEKRGEIYEPPERGSRVKTPLTFSSARPNKRDYSGNGQLVEDFIKSAELNFWSHLFHVPVSRVTRNGKLSTHETVSLLGGPMGFVDEGPPSFRASPRNSYSDDEPQEQQHQPMSFGGVKPKPSTPLREISSNTPTQSKPLIVLHKVSEPEESLPQSRPMLYFNDNVLSNSRTPDTNLYKLENEPPSRDGPVYKDLRNMGFNDPKTQILPESREVVKKPVKQISQPQTIKKKEQPKTQLSFEEQQQPEQKKVSRPNIHGKYEMFNGFYSDNFFDNCKLRTKNNQINRVLAKSVKRKRRKRMPGQATNVLTNPADPNTFILTDLEEDRRPVFSAQPRNLGLEDEQVNYRPRRTPPRREGREPMISWEEVPGRRPANIRPTSRLPSGKFVYSTYF